MSDLLPWWGWLLIGLWIGAALGFFLAAALAAGARADAADAAARQIKREAADFLGDPQDWGRS